MILDKLSLKLRFGLLRSVKPVSRKWGCDRGLSIDRYYVEKFIKENSGDIRGRVLEFKDSRYATKFGGGGVTNVDVLNLEKGIPGTTIIADLERQENIPFELFDCIICTQVLQFVYDLKPALYHLNRMLKPSGVLLVSFPFISKIDQNWNDCWRFTSFSAKKMFNEYFLPENITVQGHGNVLSSCAFLYGLCSEDLSKKELDYADPEYEMLLMVRAVKGLNR